MRHDHFVKTHTQHDVGPGSYDLAKTIDRSIGNPTIPSQAYKARTYVAGFGTRKRAKNSGSIRDNFDDADDSEEELEKGVTPGPGNYLKPFHANLFGQSSIVHKHPQNFGVTIERMNEPPMGCALGPG